MLNVKVTRLQPVVSQNANKLRAIADIEIGNGLMIYGLLYKLNKDNEFYVQMPQHMVVTAIIIQPSSRFLRNLRQE